MLKLLFFSFLMVHNFSFGFSSKVELAIKNLGLKTDEVVFVVDHKECSSCINSDLMKALEVYKKGLRRVFFINENEWATEKTHLLFNSAGFLVDSKQIVQSEVLFDYLLKTKSPLLIYTGIKFKEFTLNPDDKKRKETTHKELLVTIKDSVPIVSRNPNIPYDQFQKNGNIFFLSPDLGTVSYLVNGGEKSIDLYSKIDTIQLLEILDLDSVDYAQTVAAFAEKRLIGDRFVEFKKLCKSDDSNSFYISAIVGSEHTYSLSEKKSMMESSNTVKKVLKNGLSTEIKGSVYKTMLFQFNSNWELINYFTFSYPEDYYIQIYSDLYLVEDKIYANPRYNPGEYTSTYASKNYMVEVFKLNENDYTHSSFSTATKAQWYNHKVRRYNFLETTFQIIDNDVFIRNTSYPYWYNISENTTFEIPMKLLQKLAKKEKNKNYKKDLPAFSNIGIYKLETSDYLGFIRSNISGKVYYAEFTPHGEVLNLEELNVDPSYDGIIKILNNKLVRIKADHMLIYEIK